MYNDIGCFYNSFLYLNNYTLIEQLNFSSKIKQIVLSFSQFNFIQNLFSTSTKWMKHFSM